MKSLVFIISICVSSAIQMNEEPMVAFVCNKPAMYLSNNGWQRVEDIDCMHEPVDILNFCRRVYPGVNVTNVVESGVKVTIGNWCQVDKPNCRHPEHTVTPYKCVVGLFHSEALLVPEHCVFDHLHDEHRCQSNLGWRQVAENACVSRGLIIESSAPLSVCGIDKFQGVEYVCCPVPKRTEVKNEEKKTAHKVVPKKGPVEEKVSEEESEDDADTEEEEASEELAGNYYNRYLRKVSSELLSEHEFFARARADMNKQHRDKTNKLMADWNAAKKHVDSVKKLDPKGGENLSKEVTERFQKTYDALDQEQVAETRQLMGIHEERVQAALNKKRQDAANNFHALLNNPVQESDVVDALKRYIRIEQKIRLHDVNRYEHLADRDPTEADAVRQQIIDHLHLVDVRIFDTLDLLRQVPQWEKKIRVQMDEFLKSFHDIDAGVAGILAEQVEAQLRANPLPSARVQSEEEERSVEKSMEEQSVESSQVIEKASSKAEENKSNPISASIEDSEAVDAADDDSDMPLPPEPQLTEPEFDIAEEVKISHHEANGLEAEQMKKVKKSVHTSLGHGAVVGIAVGTVTVFIVLIVGLAVIKRRPYDVTVSHAVDDNATGEESHLSKMQANGYENPTYKYFEMRTGSQA